MSPTQLSRALRHLKRDKKLARVIAKVPKPKFERNRDPFKALCSSIIYQQLSGKAAATIHRRFIKLYNHRGEASMIENHPTAKQVAKTSVAKFRTAGVSKQKATYLRDLAEKFLDGTVDPRHFHEMTDDAIREHLVAVKGIGRWTADMFLMFTLHRPDVLPTGDLGIQKGMQKLFKLHGLPDSSHMEHLASRWRPYRTVACWYLWQIIDTKGQFD